MITFLALGLVGLLGMIAAQVFASANTLKNHDSPAAPYVSKKPLTPTEINFYQRLTEALPQYIVLAQVQLSSFIKVDLSRLDSYKTHALQNAIGQQSVDYLICTKDFSIVAAIELDDKTHLTAKAIKNDNKKNRNLAAAKIPLIRWHAESIPSVQTIQQAVTSYDTQYKETDIRPNWIADELPTFMRPKQAVGYPIKVVGLMLFISISFFLMKNTVDNFTRNLSSATVTKPPIPQKEVLVRTPSNYDLQIQERTNQALLEKQKIEDENKKRILIAEEYAIKEEVWNNHFKNKVECNNSESIVSCGNDYIRNRERFQRYWEVNKTRYIDSNVQDQTSN